MELKELQRNWNALGEIDALGFILAEPSNMMGRWDEREFFQRGVDEIDAVMEYIKPFKPGLARGEALDFGCGVGRLTQALARHFERCHGVDIAPSMVALANRYNRFGRRCRYHLNEVNDLSRFESDRFDFIYTFIVLQHMRPEYSLNYIKEFIRVLRPGGLIVFQLPIGKSDREDAIGKPLPDSGFRARVVPIDPPATMRPAARATFRVRVQNEGDAVWPALWDHEGRYQTRLGIHWYDESGAGVIFDGDRTNLARDLKPGDEAELSLAVTAPREPGRYILEVEMVQEQVAWFQWKGVAPVRLPVAVEAPARNRLSQIYRKVKSPRRPGVGLATAAPAREGIAPAMEMYCVDRSEVEALIADSGGTVLDVRVTQCPHWTHGNYCVTK